MCGMTGSISHHQNPTFQLPRGTLQVSAFMADLFAQRGGAFELVAEGDDGSDGSEAGSSSQGRQPAAARRRRAARAGVGNSGREGSRAGEARGGASGTDGDKQSLLRRRRTWRWYLTWAKRLVLIKALAALLWV